MQTAEAWLADGPPEPWCLLVALVFPHPPFEVEEPWFSLHDRADMRPPRPAPTGSPAPRFLAALRDGYRTDRLDAADWAEITATDYGMVSRVDDHLGRVLRAVDGAGAAGRTVTAFFPDHGEYLGDYGVAEKWPAGVHDALVRSPLILAGPGVPEGRVHGPLVELVDLLPTVLELAHLEAQHTHFGRGLLSGPPRDAAFTDGGFSLEEEPLLETAGFPYDVKTQLEHDDPVAVGRCVGMRTAAWSYTYRLYEGDELYDRAVDPGEVHNLSGTPDVAYTERDLRDRVLAWLLSSADVIPWTPDPRFPRIERPAQPVS